MDKLKIKKEIEDFQKERNDISASIQKLDNDKNLLVTRLVELQGIINYLFNFIEKNDEENKT